MNYSSHYLFLLVVHMLPLSALAGSCSLCGGTAMNFPKRMDCILKIQGNKATTCGLVYIDLLRIDEDDKNCDNGRDEYQSICCDEEDPGVCLTVNNSPDPEPDFKPGDYPTCNLCPEGKVPGCPNQYTHVRYFEGNTCQGHYESGKNGRIPDAVCGGFKVKMPEVCCGCVSAVDNDPPQPQPYNPISNNNNVVETCPLNEKNDLAKKCDCALKEKNKYDKCVKKAIKNSDCSFEEIVEHSACDSNNVVNDPPPPQPQPNNNNNGPTTSCPERELTNLAFVCDCKEEKPGKPWKSYEKYEKCVEKAVKNSDCTPEEVKAKASCPDFNGTDKPIINNNNNVVVDKPNNNNNNGPPSSSCKSKQAEVAKVCDCKEKKPGQPWKKEKDYLKCVAKAVKTLGGNCSVDEVAQPNCPS